MTSVRSGIGDLIHEFNFVYHGSMPEHDVILAATREYAEAFVPDQLTAAPVRKLVVLTCMDARLDLFRLLGLSVGDAHLLRNAGGRATDDAIRSLALSAHWLGTREYLVIHHTGCGLFGVTNEQIADRIEGATGTRPGFDFLPFDDVVRSVKEDVDRIQQCPLLPHDATVWGAYYDVHTGRLHEVVAPQSLETPVRACA